MNKVISALSSRTVWSAILLFLVAGVGAIHDLIPTNIITPLEGLLTFLVGYFRVNPRT